MIYQKKKPILLCTYEFIDFVPGRSVALLSKEKLGPILFFGDSNMIKGIIGRAKKQCATKQGGGVIGPGAKKMISALLPDTSENPHSVIMQHSVFELWCYLITHQI